MQERQAEPERFDRVLVTISGFSWNLHEEDAAGTVRGIISGFNGEKEVSFVLNGVGNREFLALVMRAVTNGRALVLLADVNLEAQTSEELIVKNFEIAPPPISESQLSG